MILRGKSDRDLIFQNLVVSGLVLPASLHVDSLGGGWKETGILALWHEAGGIQPSNRRIVTTTSKRQGPLLVCPSSWLRGRLSGLAAADVPDMQRLGDLLILGLVCVGSCAGCRAALNIHHDAHLRPPLPDQAGMQIHAASHMHLPQWLCDCALYQLAIPSGQLGEGGVMRQLCQLILNDFQLLHS